MHLSAIDHRYLDYRFCSDKDLIRWDIVHAWLSNHSYWARHIPLETVRCAGEHSYCIAIFQGQQQVGYARIISDYSTFGYLSDVFVAEEHRGKGLSKILLRCILDLDWVQKLRRFLLITLDAQGLYRQFGFKEPGGPQTFLEIHKPHIYEPGNSEGPN